MADSYLPCSAVYLEADVSQCVLYSKLLFCMRNVLRALSLIPDPENSINLKRVFSKFFILYKLSLCPQSFLNGKTSAIFVCEFYQSDLRLIVKALVYHAKSKA